MIVYIAKGISSDFSEQTLAIFDSKSKAIEFLEKQKDFGIYDRYAVSPVEMNTPLEIDTYMYI